MELRLDSALSVTFLGREYVISGCGVDPVDGKPVNVNNRSVLAYYVLSKGAGEPAFSFVPVSNLAGTAIVFGGNSKWMTSPLGKLFDEDYTGFSETMGKLGGVFSGRLNSGGYAWQLRVLPKIPLQIVYYEGDDEFPCEVQILFDQNATQFMEFECLAFLQGCLVIAITMTAKTGDTTGWE